MNIRAGALNQDANMLIPYAIHVSFVASGGLGGEVFIWDLEAALAPSSKSGDAMVMEEDCSNGVNGSRHPLPVTSLRSINSSNNISVHATQSHGYVLVAAKGHKESAIVQHKILNNRRHVLTKDTPGSVKLWETTRGVVIENYGKVSFDEKKELFEMVPRESLLFVIPAFGGRVSWEGAELPFDENDDSITYQIVDRPTQARRILSREYVQPQWIYDCINTRIILPTEGYLVGSVSGVERAIEPCPLTLGLGEPTLPASPFCATTRSAAPPASMPPSLPTTTCTNHWLTAGPAASRSWSGPTPNS